MFQPWLKFRAKNVLRYAKVLENKFKFLVVFAMWNFVWSSEMAQFKMSVPSSFFFLGSYADLAANHGLMKPTKELFTFSITKLCLNLRWPLLTFA